MKILFMGTPDFAAVALGALCDAGFDVAGAVTQPDKPRDRGHGIAKSAVKLEAEKRGLAVYQPETLRDNAFAPELEEIRPDVIIVVAYGKILPAYVLSFPRYGCINAHGSLLPEYRGAAPMQRALMDGKSETGITIIQMDEGIDTGDMLLRLACPITDDDDFEALHDKLAALAGEALVQTLTALEAGGITPVRQDDTKSSYAAKITREECRLDFSRPADEICLRVRALSPFPLAYTCLPDSSRLKIISAVTSGGMTEAAPGTVVSLEDGFEVACGGKTKLRVLSVLPEGKGRMDSAAFVRGRRLSVGDMLKWEK